MKLLNRTLYKMNRIATARSLKKPKENCNYDISHFNNKTMIIKKRDVN